MNSTMDLLQPPRANQTNAENDTDVVSHGAAARNSLFIAKAIARREPSPLVTCMESVDALAPIPIHEKGRDFHERAKLNRRGALRRELAELPLARSPLVLELGCGHGHFLSAYAAAHRGSICLGVDFCRDRIRRAVRKKHHLTLANLFFLHAEVGEFLDAMPRENHVADVFVLFPDPWPKRRHRKNRLVSEAFVARLADLMPSGGRLFFRTDSDDYFQEVVRVMNRATDFHIERERNWDFDCVTVFQEKAQVYRSLCGIKLG